MLHSPIRCIFMHFRPALFEFRQRQQLGCAAASLLVATDTLHKSLRAARTHPLVLCEFTELFIITKQDDQSQHTTRRAKINATGFGPWRSRGHPTHPTTRARAHKSDNRRPTKGCQEAARASLMHARSEAPTARNRSHHRLRACDGSSL